LVGIWLIRLHFKSKQGLDGITLMPGILSSMFAGAILTSNLVHLLFVTYTPRLYILEYINRM